MYSSFTMYTVAMKQTLMFYLYVHVCQLAEVFLCNSKLGVEVTDFSTSWRDGMAFNAMVHTVRNDLVDLDSLPHHTNKDRLEQAFSIADRELGIPKLIDPEGTCGLLCVSHVDCCGSRVDCRGLCVDCRGCMLIVAG